MHTFNLWGRPSREEDTSGEAVTDIGASVRCVSGQLTMLVGGGVIEMSLSESILVVWVVRMGVASPGRISSCKASDHRLTSYQQSQRYWRVLDEEASDYKSLTDGLKVLDEQTELAWNSNGAAAAD